MTQPMSREELKRLLLELLRSDREFRRAVAAEVGLLEILERLDRLEERMVKLEERIEEHTRAIRALQEEVKKLWEAVKDLQEQMVKLQEQVAENTKAIRALQEETRRLWEAVRGLQEQVKALQEQVARNTERLERLEAKLTALGARWGIEAEVTVREALRKILEEYLGKAKVEKWVVFDEEGVVFGRPEYIDIDVVVKDDVRYLIELKSSVDRYDVYMFSRKCDFYVERVKPKRHKRVMIAFFVEPGAEEAARRLGVEIIQG